MKGAAIFRQVGASTTWHCMSRATTSKYGITSALNAASPLHLPISLIVNSVRGLALFLTSTSNAGEAQKFLKNPSICRTNSPSREYCDLGQASVGQAGLASLPAFARSGGRLTASLPRSRETGHDASLPKVRGNATPFTRDCRLTTSYVRLCFNWSPHRTRN